MNPQAFCPDTTLSTCSQIPAFIGGFRSGTTLLINLLGMHPLVVPWYETKELCEALRWLKVLKSPAVVDIEKGLIQPLYPAGFNIDSVKARMACHMRQTFLRMNGRVESGKAGHECYHFGGDYVLYGYDEAEAVLAQWFAASRGASDAYDTHKVAAATGNLIRTLGNRQMMLSGKSRWINKTPEIPRFGYELRQSLGECKILLMVRNGWDVVSSAYALGWGSIEKLAFWWKALIEQSRDVAQEGYYMEIRYEDLIAFPEETLDKVLDFFELPQMGKALCASYWQYTESAFEFSKHKRTMRSQRELFDRIAGQLMESLGYV